MSTLIVSDIHIGDYKSGHQDFMAFLDTQPDVKKLIIAGDLFDLWVVGAGRALKEGQYLLNYIAQRFGRNAIYLTGNHDEDFKYLQTLNDIRVKEFHAMRYNDKRVLVCHGHQYDSSFYLDKVEWLARFNAWLVNRVDKTFGIDTRKWLVSLSEGIENDPYDKLIFTYEYNLKKEFTNVHDVIITGHTHLACIKEFTNLVYINTGDSMQHRTAVLFDDEEGSISLVDYSNKEIEVIHKTEI